MSNAGQDRRIDYIEFSVKSVPDAKRFYGQAFGWTFEDYGPDYASFSDGRLGGGFQTAAKVQTGGGPLVIIYATDLEAMEQKVRQAGGGIARPIFSFPGGRRFHFTDPSGYELAVWSDK
ncbi:MAG TPA: VOC family protein [Gemmatimonadales bacterium]|nr:VOC family protein [Gemmatimonadales bacterium]